jgi:hypothetical protein
MLFAFAPYAYTPSYPSDGSGSSAPLYPVYHLTEMQRTLAALADVAVQREMDRDRIEPEGQTDAE